MEKIIFTLEYGSEWIPKMYYPVPAVKAVPEWYKKMETSFAEDKTDKYQVKKTQTVKRCMPVLDAMTAGYILKTHTDILVKNENGVLGFEWASDTSEGITFHPPSQLINYREMDLPFGAAKLRNPWNIRTSKGYSCLFIPPAHQPENGIRILEGVVDTDTYCNAVQFPFLVDKDFTGTIPAGTPVVQVIPFKRTSFRMEIGSHEEREKSAEVLRVIRSTWVNGYRNNFRADKDYL